MEQKSLFQQWHEGKRTQIGSFEHSLYECFYKASTSNQRKLRLAFPEFFEGQSDFY